jgi:hypothetical protein
MDGPMHPMAMPEMLVGASALPSAACTARTGPANVDGRCVHGGRVYVATNVPYTSGRVAGSSYERLSDIYTNTRLNDAWAAR